MGSLLPQVQVHLLKSLAKLETSLLRWITINPASYLQTTLQDQVTTKSKHLLMLKLLQRISRKEFILFWKKAHCIENMNRLPQISQSAPQI